MIVTCINKFIVPISVALSLQIFRLAAFEGTQKEIEICNEQKHILLRVVERKYCESLNYLQGVSGDDHEAEILEFYYLGRAQAFREMRYFLLPIKED